MATSALAAEPPSYDPSSLPQRIRDRITITDDGCWQWTGYTRKNGYGEISDKGTHLAHRWTYEHLAGPIPDGHDLDHLCHNRGCVNPTHLEAVDHAENMNRKAEVAGSRLPDAAKPYTIKTSEQARALALKSAESRRAKALAKREKQALDQARQQRSTEIILATPSDNLTARIREATAQHLEKLLADEVPIRNVKEWADAYAVLHSSLRLEEGQPTTLGVNVTASLDELTARLRDRIPGKGPEATDR